jgi:hypothetical protein
MMAEKNDVVPKDADPDQALEILQTERTFLRAKLYRTHGSLDRKRIARRLEAVGREIAGVKAVKRASECLDLDSALRLLEEQRQSLRQQLSYGVLEQDRRPIITKLQMIGRSIARIKKEKLLRDPDRLKAEEKRSSEISAFVQKQRQKEERQPTGGDEPTREKPRVTAQAQLPAPVGSVLSSANIIPHPTRSVVPMSDVERQRLHRNRERAGQVLITIAVNEAALVPRLIADGLLDERLADQTSAVGFALGELLVLYTRLPAEWTRDWSINPLRLEEKVRPPLEEEHTMQQKNDDDPDAEIRAAVIKEVQKLDGEKLRHLMLRLLDRDPIGMKHKPNDASTPSKPAKRRPRNSTYSAPVQRALTVIKRGTPEEVLDAIQNELHYPAPPDRDEAIDWVKRALNKRRDALREWPDGSWSHLNWRPELAVAK